MSHTLYPLPRPPIQNPAVVPPDTLVYPVNQPVFAYYRPDVNRYLAKPSLVEGFTNQGTQPVPPISQPELIRFKNLHWNRYLVEPVKWFETRLAPQSYIFPVSNPLFNYYKPEINRYLWSSPGYIRVSPPGNPTSTITVIFSNQATARPIMPVAYLLQVNRRIASISPNTGQESGWQPPFNQ